MSPRSISLTMHPIRLDSIDQPPDFVFELAEARRGKRRAQAGQSRPARGLPVMQGRIGLQQLDGQVAAALEELLDERFELADEGVGAFGRKEFHMSSLRIVLVTGVSGAGLSQAIKSFEDLGFYCIEHLPPVVLDSTVSALERSTVEDIAIALDVRSDEGLGDPGSAIDSVLRTA